MCFLLHGNSFAQSISGYILNESEEPIAFANIFFKQLQNGTTSDENGYYYLQLNPSEYDLVISSIGYETQTSLVKIDQDVIANFQLQESDYLLDEITIKASKKDPAFEIIKMAIENRKKFNSSVSEFKAELYIKANEVIDITQKTNEKIRPAKNINESDDNLEVDLVAQKRAELEAEMSKYNLLETKLNLSYQYPEKYKEEKTAYKLYGSKAGLFIPRFDEIDFNFYENMVELKGIAELPVVSPLARTSILSYKYKLISTKKEGEHLVHAIQVIPRKQGNGTVAGMIYIIDDAWNILRLDLDLPKGNLRQFDVFNLKMDYEELEAGKWVATRQEYTYQTKYGKRKKYNGSTRINFLDIDLYPDFPPKYFGNEISSITQDAYDLDSTYWNKNRPEALDSSEQKFVLYKDSVETILNSKEYKDSIQQAFNKVDLLEVAYEGLGFRNHEKKQTIWISPIAGLLDFDVVGGFRFGPYFSYSRRFDNGQFYRSFNNFNIGHRNLDFNGWTNHQWVYGPMKQASLNLNLSRAFRPINPYDAFLNQLQASNYILHTNVGGGHSIEILNGLYLRTQFDWSARSDISDLERGSFLEDIIEQGMPPEFEPYETSISDIVISFTPAQKYMTEPKRKIVLASEWPTFSLLHRKGWNGLFSSDVDFDYLEFSIEQSLILGIFGNSRYRFLAGQFVNTNLLTFIDVKRFRESDPYIYLDPLHNFQVLDTSLVTTKPFLEFHYIHHFNGALINNIPLLKKTRIGLVAGGGALYVAEDNYWHQEIFAGIERTFKIGPRRRLRLGAYGVVGNSNLFPTKTEYKFSIDLIDTWKNDWSF